MAMCDYCKQDMLTADSCIFVPVKVNGKEYQPVKYGAEKED